ncbi:MAG: tRNA (adenosine(37)-N6)-dimethylallyltransferase MiaA [Eubacterium sp.]
MNNHNEPLIIITGPTAVGKTDISIALAKKINGEIISADSIQVYKYMNIGSAKISNEEMDGIKHYLIDEFEPDEEFNISIFKRLATEYINKIREKGKIPIIVGGTGFYIQSVLYNIDFTPTNDDGSVRRELEKLASTNGPEYMHNLLNQIDPESASIIHANNVKRVIRAIEYFRLTGSKISVHNNEQRQKKSAYNFVYFVLNNDREVIYERINNRVDLMIDKGLVEEVQNLINMGYNKNLTSMQGLGYKEIIDYLDGKISLDEAIYIIKRDTRHFAKRQITWFKREQDVTEINYADYNNDKNALINDMIKIINQKNII